MRILVIDDEFKLLNLIRQELATQGYEVDIAADGRNGLELANESPYDLIVLDLMLPEIDGVEVLRRLRSQTSSVPVLILSARSSAEGKATCKEVGADDYLTKPFDVAELLSRVKALLGRRLAHDANTIRVGDLELDKVSQLVKRGGQHIQLTSKEYRLLEFLINNAGRFVSRNMIVEHFWDEGFGAVTNIVDVYFSQLRNKIDGGHEAKLLHAVRGMGYTIREHEHQNWI